MKQTNQTVNRKRWMRTGAVGVVFLAAVLCFGVQSRREKQTVVLETQNGFSKEVDDSQESSERPAKWSNGGAVDGDNEAAENAAPEGQSKENPQTPEPRSLYIHVCGEVAAPGVYELPAGSRMYEAVEKAGGMTSEAAQEYVNLAQAIEDGQQLRIPSREEIRKYQETGKDVSGLLGAGGAAGNGSESASQKSGSSAALINLNTASKEELMTLNGVGAARAEAILSYREQKGGFRTIEDIMKVPGIKNAAFQRIKDKITV